MYDRVYGEDDIRGLNDFARFLRKFGSSVYVREPEELRKTIRSMEPGEREILILKYYSHMSNAQIAKKLNIKEGTVRVKLMRARQRLYKLILKSDSGSERPYDTCWNSYFSARGGYS